MNIVSKRNGVVPFSHFTIVRFATTVQHGKLDGKMSLRGTLLYMAPEMLRDQRFEILCSFVASHTQTNKVWQPSRFVVHWCDIVWTGIWANPISLHHVIDFFILTQLLIQPIFVSHSYDELIGKILDSAPVHIFEVMIDMSPLTYIFLWLVILGSGSNIQSICTAFAVPVAKRSFETIIRVVFFSSFGKNIVLHMISPSDWNNKGQSEAKAS